MQLFQVRGFGEMLSDTFAFLKESGGHFIKNYIIINIPFMIISVLSSLPLVNLFFDFDNFESKPTDAIVDLITNNIGILIMYIILMMIFTIIYYIINMAYTPIYFNLYRENQGTNFSIKEIIGALKENLGKLIKSTLGFILISIPLLIILMVAIMVVACTVVGILIPIIAMIFLTTFTLYEYLQKPENRFWDSFGYGWTLTTYKFWHSLGAYAIILICVFGVQIIFSSIFIGHPETSYDVDPFSIQNQNEIFAAQFGQLGVSLFQNIFNSIIGFFTNIPLAVIAAIIFYSLKGEKENIVESSNIDQIGNE